MTVTVTEFTLKKLSNAATDIACVISLRPRGCFTDEFCSRSTVRVQAFVEGAKLAPMSLWPPVNCGYDLSEAKVVSLAVVSKYMTI